MATSKDVIKSFTIKVNTENGKVKIDGLTKSYVAADVALDKMTAGLQQNTAALNQQATAANKAGNCFAGEGEIKDKYISKESRAQGVTGDPVGPIIGNAISSKASAANAN